MPVFRNVLIADSGTGHVEEMVRMLREIPPCRQARLNLLHVMSEQGGADLQEHRQKATALMEAAEGLPVRFPGFVTDRAQLARMLASADIYVSAMADETFGLSVLEAQASGLPVVGFASGAMVQRVPPALGRLVPLDDTAAMATAVVEVWHGDHAAMGLQAREHVTTQFGWQRTFDMLLAEIYPRALARSAARSEARNLVRWRSGQQARQRGQGWG